MPDIKLLLSLCLLAGMTVLVKAEEDEWLFQYNFVGTVKTGAIATAMSTQSERTVTGAIDFWVPGKNLMNGYVGMRVRIHSTNDTMTETRSNSNFDEKLYPSKVTQRMSKEKIENPFWLKYEHGLIESVEFVESNFDPRLANFQKSLASLFQLDVRPLLEDSDNDIYSIQEDGIGGKCETSYRVFLLKNSSIRIVIKTRSYKKCEHRPHIFTSTIDGYKCPKEQISENTHRPLTTKAEVLYDLHGNLGHITIDRIVSDGTIRLDTLKGLPPFESITNLRIELVGKAMSERKFKRKNYQLKEPQSLHYEFPSYPDVAYDHGNDKDKSEFERMGLPRVYLRNKTEQDVEDWFKHTEELLLKFRTFTKEDFHTYYEKNVGYFRVLDWEKNLNRKMVLSILPVVGTKASMDFIFSLLTSNHLPETYAIQLLENFQFHIREPNDDLIEELWSLQYLEALAKPGIPDGEKKLFGPILSAFGRTLYRGCVITDFNPKRTDKETYAHEQVCSKFTDKLVELFYHQQDEEIQLLVLKAITNTRSPKTLPVLYEVAEGISRCYTASIRIEAVSALSSFPDDKTRKDDVQRLLYSITANCSEDAVLRVTAFQVLLEVTSSPKNTLNKIGELLEDEGDLMVAGFMYSTLMSLANSTTPCNEHLQPHAKEVLETIKRANDFNPIRHGMNHFSECYSRRWEYGESVQLSLLGNDQSFLPRFLKFKYNLNMMGYNFDYFEVTLAMNHLTALESFFKMYMLEHQDKRDRFLNLKDTSKLSNDTVGPTLKAMIKIFGLDKTTINLLGDNPMDDNEPPYHDNLLARFTTNYLTDLRIKLTIPNELGYPTSIGGGILIHSLATAKEWNATDTMLDLDGNYLMGETVSSYMEVAPLLGKEDGVELDTKLTVDLPLNMLGSIDDSYSAGFKLRFFPPTTKRNLLTYNGGIWVYSDLGRHKVEVLEPSPPFNERIFPDWFGPNVYLASNSSNYFLSMISSVHMSLMVYGQDEAEFLKDIMNIIYTPKFFVTDMKLYIDPSPFNDHHVEEVQLGIGYLNFEDTTAYTSTGGKFDISLKCLVEKEMVISDVFLSFYLKSGYPLGDTGEIGIDVVIPKLEYIFFEEHGGINATLAIRYLTENYPHFFNHNLWLNVEPKLGLDGSLVIECHGCEVPNKFEVLLKVNASHLYDPHTLTSSKDFKECHSCKLFPFYNEACLRLVSNLTHVNYATFDMRTVPARRLPPIELLASIPKLKTTGSIRYTPEGPYVNTTTIVGDHYISSRQITPDSFMHERAKQELIIPSFDVYEHSKSFLTEECLVSQDHMATFDGLTYEYQLNEDYHTVYSDCISGDLNVALKNGGHGLMVAEVIIGKYFLRFEVKRISDKSVEILVNRDGKDLGRMKEKKSFVQKDESTDLPVYVVSKYYDAILIDVISSGRMIVFDGNYMLIQVTDFDKSKTCGLCGRFDGRTDYEFVGVDGTHFDSVDDFVNSCVVRN